MIIIINGSLGVGKTETSWELTALFERAVMLDGDYIGAVHPFEIHNSQRVEYLYQTIHHLMIWHQQNGYDDFVINYVFERPKSLYTASKADFIEEVLANDERRMTNDE